MSKTKDPDYTAQRDAAAEKYAGTEGDIPDYEAFIAGSDHEHERAKAETCQKNVRLNEENHRLTARVHDLERTITNMQRPSALEVPLLKMEIDRLTAENAEIRECYQTLFGDSEFNYANAKRHADKFMNERDELRAKLSLETAEIKRLCGLLTDAKSRLEKAEADLRALNGGPALGLALAERARGERDTARAMAKRLAGALEEMYESSCRNANSTPSKAAFIKAREALAEFAAYEAGER
jgi:chromosome segregation ATPase